MFNRLSAMENKIRRIKKNIHIYVRTDMYFSLIPECISIKYDPRATAHQVNIALRSVQLIMETVILCNSRHATQQRLDYRSVDRSLSLNTFHLCLSMMMDTVSQPFCALRLK